MSRLRTSLTGTTTVIVALTIFASGCGAIAERAAEEAVERAVESESGENIEVDIGGDGVSIESDEGDFSLRADEDGFELDGTDGDGNDFSVDGNQDGIEAKSDNGASLDVDADGSFTASDAEGEVASGDVGVDGNELDFTIEGDDGATTFSSGEGIPEQWPSDVPEPEGLDDVVGTYAAETDGAENVAVTGTTGDSAKDAVASYGRRLAEAGFEQTGGTDQGDEFANAIYERDGRAVTVTAANSGDRTDVVIAIVNT